MPKITPQEGPHWDFQGNGKVKFADLEHDKTRFDCQGSEIPLVGFDELTHFSW